MTPLQVVALSAAVPNSFLFLEEGIKDGILDTGFLPPSDPDYVSGIDVGGLGTPDLLPPYSGPQIPFAHAAVYLNTGGNWDGYDNLDQQFMDISSEVQAGVSDVFVLDRRDGEYASGPRDGPIRPQELLDRGRLPRIEYSYDPFIKIPGDRDPEQMLSVLAYFGLRRPRRIFGRLTQISGWAWIDDLIAA